MPRQERTKSGTGIYHVMLRGTKMITESPGHAIGTYVVTNNGKAANEPIGNDPSLLLGENKNFGAHTHGEVFSAPLWVGYKYNNQICRIGVGHPYVQDLTQNAVHHYIITSEYNSNSSLKIQDTA